LTGTQFSKPLFRNPQPLGIDFLYYIFYSVHAGPPYSDRFSE
jgi:hypothetical protein